MHAQVDAAGGGQRRVLRGQVGEEFRGVEIRQLRGQRACVQAGDVEQAFQQLLGRTQRGVDALGQVALLGHGVAFAQGRGEQAGGVERLQDVVADRGQEAGA